MQSTLDYTVDYSTYIMAGSKMNLTKNEQSGLYTQLAWNAQPDNAITLTNSAFSACPQNGKILEENRLALLGGQVNVANCDMNVGEFFVGTGNGSMDQEINAKDPYPQHWNSYNFMVSVTNGGAVHFDKDTKIATVGQTDIDAGKITNEGSIIETNEQGLDGIDLLAYNKGDSSDIDASTAHAYIDVDQDNTVINNGTIKAGKEVSVIANNFMNNGTVKTGNEGTYTIVLADKLTGSGTDLQQVPGVIQGVNDKQYDAKNPFNRIIGTFTKSAGSEDYDQINWSFATVGMPIPNPVPIPADGISADELMVVRQRQGQLDGCASSRSTAAYALTLGKIPATVTDVPSEANAMIPDDGITVHDDNAAAEQKDQK